MDIDPKISCQAVQQMAQWSRRGEYPEVLEYVRGLQDHISKHIPASLSRTWVENERLKLRIQQLDKQLES